MKAVNFKEFGKPKIVPREFLCRSIGNDCSWKHLAKTEELLLDAAALHLRDVHNIQSLSVELIGKIKRSFLNPTSVSEYESDIPELKEFRCRDIGMACSWKYLAQTEELIVDGAAVHARDVHGIKDFSPEMIAKVKNAVHVWPGEKAAA